MRRLFVIALVALSLFCGYGYRAAMEPGEGHDRWRLGYGLLGTAALLGAAALSLRKTTPDEQGAEDERG